MSTRKIDRSPSGKSGVGRPLPPFQRTVELHGQKVLRFCAAQVGGSDADDCFQETMLSALKAYDSVRDAGAIQTWLFAIAARKATDFHRSRARGGESGTLVEMVDTGEVLSEADDALWAAVRELPEKQRYAVTLRFVADLAHVQIAEVMQSSEDAARRNVFEGLKRLREKVKK